MTTCITPCFSDPSILSVPTPSERKSQQVNDKHDASNDTIRDLSLRGVVSQLEPKPTIDDSKDNQGAAKPHVHMGKSGPTLLAAIDQVVNYASDWLEKQEAKDHEADDGMCVIQLHSTNQLTPLMSWTFSILKLNYKSAYLARGSCEPDSDADAGSHDHVRENLGSCVDPYRAIERQDPDRKSAKGEENAAPVVSWLVKALETDFDLQKRERHQESMRKGLAIVRRLRATCSCTG